jgi:dTMP kinase
VLLTREPGGTPIGDQVRAVLLDNPANTAMHPRTEFLLFSAGRAQHVEERLRPALEAGRLVICDRYADSSLAYQGYGHRLDLPTLRKITEFATGGLWPDLTLYIDVDPATGLERRRRASGGGQKFDRLDASDIDFHERVRAGYLALIEVEPWRWVVIDGRRPVEAVQADVCAAVLPRLPPPPGRRP